VPNQSFQVFVFSHLCGHTGTPSSGLRLRALKRNISGELLQGYINEYIYCETKNDLAASKEGSGKKTNYLVLDTNNPGNRVTLRRLGLEVQNSLTLPWCGRRRRKAFQTS
jgi:hypothetical protein